MFCWVDFMSDRSSGVGMRGAVEWGWGYVLGSVGFIGIGVVICVY